MADPLSAGPVGRHHRRCCLAGAAMTTPTIAPTIPDAEIEAWLNHELEKPCEIWLNLILAGVVRPGSQCGVPANWLMYTRPECGHQALSTFICDRHRDRSSRIVCGGDGKCKEPANPTWIERIKGGVA